MHTKTLYINLVGRIGNNLFQIAAAMSLAKRHKAKVVAIPDPYYRLPFPDEGKSLYVYLKPYQKAFFRNIEISRNFPDSFVKYDEPSFCYNELPFADKIYLFGYFQSEKYFDIPYIRKTFSISPQNRSSLMDKFGNLLNLNPVSINVRRGDYLLQTDYHPVCSIEYYQKCIDLIGRERCFIVTSDDVAWCKENFKGKNFHVIEEITPLENLYLQSLCHGHIISNSTFSWWGAWLNPNMGKKVFAPRKWFGKRLSHHETKDLFPQNWIVVEE